ncbi:hypothetical protein [Streptomyces sp. NPDC056660]|uniref:hypothetical protein n=1 Tax=Streptomyces sp. NPDC056660 TaxID=3345897 RepID=UPI0036858A95
MQPDRDDQQSRAEPYPAPHGTVSALIGSPLEMTRFWTASADGLCGPGIALPVGLSGG